MEEGRGARGLPCVTQGRGGEMMMPLGNLGPAVVVFCCFFNRHPDQKQC